MCGTCVLAVALMSNTGLWSGETIGKSKGDGNRHSGTHYRLLLLLLHIIQLNSPTTNVSRVCDFATRTASLSLSARRRRRRRLDQYPKSPWFPKAQLSPTHTHCRRHLLYAFHFFIFSSSSSASFLFCRQPTERRKGRQPPNNNSDNDNVLKCSNSSAQVMI